MFLQSFLLVELALSGRRSHAFLTWWAAQLDSAPILQMELASGMEYISINNMFRIA